MNETFQAVLMCTVATALFALLNMKATGSATVKVATFFLTVAGVITIAVLIGRYLLGDPVV